MPSVCGKYFHINIRSVLELVDYNIDYLDHVFATIKRASFPCAPGIRLEHLRSLTVIQNRIIIFVCDIRDVREMVT